jgi:hypothetical protein
MLATGARSHTVHGTRERLSFPDRVEGEGSDAHAAMKRCASSAANGTHGEWSLEGGVPRTNPRGKDVQVWLALVLLE